MPSNRGCFKYIVVQIDYIKPWSKFYRFVYIDVEIVHNMYTMFMKDNIQNNPTHTLFGLLSERERESERKPNSSTS